MPDDSMAPASILCPTCGTQIAAGLLTCPLCNRLTFADRLRDIAGRAETEARSRNLTAALAQWREALELLPPGTRQHQAILAKVDALSRQLESAPRSSDPAAKRDGSRKTKFAGLGALAALLLLLSKFKFVLVLILTKAKFLLLGLSKMGTLWTMFLSFGVYWAAWGWPFALGLVLSIYVHEMGHVAALRRYGIKATAPMFIPGVGAMVRLRQPPTSPREDARIGLAGPWWGMGAAMAAFAVWGVTEKPMWAAIAQTGAWLNLFNLLPIWQLDGGRGFNAFSRAQAWIMLVPIVGMYLWTHESLLVLIGILAVYRAIKIPASVQGDRPALLQCAALVVILSAMAYLLGPITGQHP